MLLAMRLPAFLAALPLLCCATVRPGPARVEVGFETRIALPVVLASVDGGPPQAFILDTGAAVSLLEAGALPAGPTRIASLTVGGMTFREVSAQRASLPANLGAAGILSPQDAFRGALVELDGRELVLRLYQDLDEAGWRELVGEPAHSEPLLWEDGLATVQARVGEESLALRLDSGSGACTVPRALLDRLGYVGKAEVSLPVAVGASRPWREQIFVLEGPGSVGYPWFLGRRTAIALDRAKLLFTERR